ncbi:MAG TPA: hypothetical protein VL330_09080 [Actinomycetes bacterium]|nr:hypothetical protein [Actinomycetes bacterium]
MPIPTSPDGHDDPLAGRAGPVALRGDESTDGRAGVLDDIQPKLTRGLVELVHDITVGTAALQPFPDERGEAVAAVRVSESLQLDEGVPTVPLDDLRQASLDLHIEGVEHVAEVHPGAPAPHVVPFGEQQPHRQPIPIRRSDEAGEPREGVRIDERHWRQVDDGDARIDIKGQDTVKVEEIQGGPAGLRHEREYRSSRNARPEPDDICG